MPGIPSILCVMNTLIPRMILIGLAASVSPVAVMVLISLMTAKHPRKNTLLFLLSYTLTLVAIGVVFVLLFHARSGASNHKASGYIDIGIGVLCLLAIPLAARKRKEKPATEERGLTVTRTLTIGAGTMLVNTSTLLIYITGLHAISDARLPFADDVVAFVILTFATLLTLLIPIFIELAFPKASEKALTALRVWLVKHQRIISVGILVIFATYLLVKGIKSVV
ncbi:MAG TPA: GAP family protein [Candidatus Anoxymicrobiaceae bacterium]